MPVDTNEVISLLSRRVRGKKIAALTGGKEGCVTWATEGPLSPALGEGRDRHIRTYYYIYILMLYSLIQTNSRDSFYYILPYPQIMNIFDRIVMLNLYLVSR